MTSSHAASHAVISGASIAGLSAAHWLRRIGWEVTLLERAPAFRDGGQNVDVRGVAREVLDRMGLFDAVKALNTTETGTVLVDGRGGTIAELPSNGPDGATAELEVLRGDFARAILDHLPPGIEIVYGDTVADVDEHDERDERDERGGAITVTTASGRVLHADLLVVAEGVRSATRDRLFGGTVNRRDLGINMVFGTIPRTPGDDDRWRWYNTVGGRQVHLRPDNHGTTRAILAHAHDEDFSALDHDEALARIRACYADAGWEAPRVLDGFDTSEDVYVDRLTQIRMRTWHRGRVCLVGDAAWCVTPMGGGGASLALTGGYVLAAHLSTVGSAGPAGPAGLETALAAYEGWMRPLVDSVQKLPPGLTHMAYPRTRPALALRNLVSKALVSAPLAPLTAKLTQVADTDRSLPRMTVPA
ncbi:FAD-dependent monooxygenase [Streptomyces sp. MMBL 11-3]|uniref:FAD-dependent monooxygenase n=1 Tax=Streptomyces sp. MMBL 11-3 TaxID=3382639 RepID=UPI0039B4EACC